MTDAEPSAEAMEIAKDTLGFLTPDEDLALGLAAEFRKISTDVARALDAFAARAVERERALHQWRPIDETTPRHSNYARATQSA